MEEDRENCLELTSLWGSGSNTCTCTGFRMGWSSSAVGKRNFIVKDQKSL